MATSAVYHNQRLKNLAKNLELITENAPSGSFPTKDEMVSTVRRLVAIRNKHNIDPVVLIVPSRLLWVGSDKLIADAGHAFFIGTLRKEGFTVVDPRSFFERDGAPLQYHFANDGHWNPNGHRIAAGLLYQHMKGKNCKACHNQRKRTA